MPPEFGGRRGGQIVAEVHEPRARDMTLDEALIAVGAAEYPLHIEDDQLRVALPELLELLRRDEG